MREWIPDAVGFLVVLIPLIFFVARNPRRFWPTQASLQAMPESQKQSVGPLLLSAIVLDLPLIFVGFGLGGLLIAKGESVGLLLLAFGIWPLAAFLYGADLHPASKERETGARPTRVGSRVAAVMDQAVHW